MTIYSKDNMLPDREFLDSARKNWAEFRNELEERIKRLPTLAQLDAIYQKQLLGMRSCPECKLICKTQWHMEYRHRGSNVCKERVASQNDETFVADAKKRVVCECKIEVFQCNLAKHKQGVLHQNMMAKLNGYFCKPCGKKFSGRRPKVCYKQHCKSKKHLRLLEVKKISYLVTNDVSQAKSCGHSEP